MLFPHQNLCLVEAQTKFVVSFHMPFVYTKHVSIRIKQRSLMRNQIEQAVLQPDKIMPSFKGRLMVRKDFSGNDLEVVYRQEGENKIIITAYWLKEV